MSWFKLSLAITLSAVQIVLPTACFAGFSENTHESGLQTGMQNSTQAFTQSASESSVSNGNEAGSYHGSSAWSQAGSENGASFFIVTAPSYIPTIPSGITPVNRTIRTSNYVGGAPMPSNYVVSSDNSLSLPELQPKQSAQNPQVKVWNANRRYAVKRHKGNEMLASKPATEVSGGSTESEAIIAPVHYYPVSSQSDRSLPFFAGYPLWPDANAFDHN